MRTQEWTHAPRIRASGRGRPGRRLLAVHACLPIMHCIVVLSIVVLSILPAATAPAQSSFTFSAAQSSVSDWQDGTRSTLDLTSVMHLKEEVLMLGLRASGALRLAAGFRRERLSDSTAPVLLPTDNELFAEAVVSRPLRWRVDPYISASLRTPLTESFRARGVALLRTAQWWDPVTSQQACGFTWEHRSSRATGSLRLGLAWKQIRTRNHTAQTDLPSTRNVIERWKQETGVEFVYDATISIDSLISWRGRVTVFGSFDGTRPWSGQSDNEFHYRIWRFIGCVLTLRLLHDPATRTGLQFRQSLSIGVLHRF